VMRSLSLASVLASTYSIPCWSAHSWFGKISKARTRIPNPRRISATLWPITTCLTCSACNIAALTSPVKAPPFSQCMFWAPTPRNWETLLDLKFYKLKMVPELGFPALERINSFPCVRNCPNPVRAISHTVRPAAPKPSRSFPRVSG
jgi:hypothetical protein